MLVRRVVWHVVPYRGIRRAAATIEFILFPPDLDPSSGQDIFHGSVIELGELLVEFVVREESLPKGVDGGLLVTE